MARYDMTETEWRYIQPSLPTKVRGKPRVGDRRVINGIFYILRSGCAWRDLPQRYGAYTTVYNRFNRWAKAGIWDRIMDVAIAANEGDVVMIDSTSVRVHHAGAMLKKTTQIDVWVVQEAG